MRLIKVYIDAELKEFVKVPLHFQFYFYYYLPYVLLADLKDIDSNAISLFRVDEKNERIANTKDDQRIYLTQFDNQSLENGIYVLNPVSERSNRKYRTLDTVGQDCIDVNHIRNITVPVSHDCDLLADNYEKNQGCLSSVRRRKSSGRSIARSSDIDT